MDHRPNENMYQLICYTCEKQLVTDLETGQNLFIDHTDQYHEVELVHVKSKRRDVEFELLPDSATRERTGAVTATGSGYPADE